MAKIIVFDSGIGGLSILKELIKDLPNHNYIYLADQAYFPYGSHTQPWVNSRVTSIIKQALSHFEPAIVVLACNSATVTAIQKIRQLTKVPIVGVEPVIKPLQSYSSPALLATKVTLESTQTKSLLAKYPIKKLLLQEAEGLAEQVESLDLSKAMEVIQKLRPKLQNTDALGLSCTHYPLVKDIFRIVLGAKIKLLDPSTAVSHRVAHILRDHTQSTPQQSFYTTADVLRLKEQLIHYLKIAKPLCHKFQIKP